MSACICRQSGSLTLENVKCAMNLGSVLTKCSRDPVNRPSGDKHVCDVHCGRSESVTSEKLTVKRLSRSLPFFQVLFCREQAADAAKGPLVPCREDVLASGTPARAKALVQVLDVPYCN